MSVPESTAMEEVDLEHCYRVAQEAVASVEKDVLKAFNHPGKVQFKAAWWDVVTECDKNTEVALIGIISKAFPTHKFLAEETAAAAGLSDDPTWIIDPIDGTTNFTHGDPQFGISVGFAVKREVVLGVICAPALGMTFTALKGKGAFMNGNKISTSGIEDSKLAVLEQEISIGGNPQLTEKLIRQFSSCVTEFQGMRSCGSCAVGLCRVAMGRSDAYQVDAISPWDVAAGAIIVTEAGGAVLDVEGGKFDCATGRIIAASSKKLANAIVEILRK